MTRYRIKVVLLSLGVVLGFGSAIARHHYWEHGTHHDAQHHGHHGHGGWGECWHGGPWSDEASPQVTAPKSAAPAQGTAPKTH